MIGRIKKHIASDILTVVQNDLERNRYMRMTSRILCDDQNSVGSRLHDRTAIISKAPQKQLQDL